MHYEYVHILWADDAHLKFYKSLVMMIKYELNINDHYFVSPHKDICNGLKEYVYVEHYKMNKINRSSIVRAYLDRGNWIFLHGLMTRILIINPLGYKKIIWRTWGGDVHFQFKEGAYLKNFLRKALTPLRKHIIRNFYAVGTANTVDEIDIKQLFGNIHTVRIGYPSKDSDRIRSMLMEFKSDRHTGVNVFVGHSGYRNDNHIEILKSLQRFIDKGVVVHLILSYGDPQYIEEVEAYVSENWKDKAVIYKEFIKYQDYIMLLANMDIAVFDAKTSYALGNIAWFLEMKKTIVLNRDGVIKKAFDQENIPYICSDRLKEIDFVEFTRKLDYSNMGSGMKMTSYNESVCKWKCFLSELDTVRRDRAGGYNL